MTGLLSGNLLRSVSRSGSRDFRAGKALCIRSRPSNDEILSPSTAEETRPRPASTSSSGSPSRFLITGALGQIGLELMPYLRSRFGADSVIGSDIRAPLPAVLREGPFYRADARDVESLAEVIHEHRVGTVIHLASLLSAAGEKNPQLALDVNIKGIQNVLELARKYKLRLFAPSTIAVFGPSAAKDFTPETTILDPTTIYGITKVHLELLGQYYRSTHGVDFRSIRYPGIVSAHSMPGGGTTDYAVEMFHAALESGVYQCFLEPDQALPMMYMPDCLKATTQLVLANSEALSRGVYNVTSMSFTPRELAHHIQQHIPAFSISFRPDFRQGIASTWPRSIDDHLARQEWSWQPFFDLKCMTADMIHELAPQYILHEEAAAVATL